MWFSSLFAAWRSGHQLGRRPRSPAARRGTAHLTVRSLEHRALPSSYSAASVAALIADINVANQSGGTNSIALTAPTTSPYLLGGGNALPVIAKKDNLTIVGNADTIDAQNACRLFNVAAGASLTLDNLTLQNGEVSGSGTAAEGGGIYNQGALALSGVTLQGCIAQGSNTTGKGQTGSPAAGGGIWSSGSLTLEHGTVVQNNQAVGGNGLPGGQFTRGTAGGDAFGGGLYIAAGQANLTGVTISNNTALAGQGGTSGNAYGGGLYVDAATMAVSGSTVDNNQADLGATSGFLGFAYGGGLYVAGGKLNLSSDTVDGNLSGSGSFFHGDGGGMYVATGTVTLCDDTVENNQAYGAAGGGIFIASSGNKVFIDSFTVANTITNTDGSGTNGSTANIVGPYTVQNC
jgi:hypothetical protein